jgi:hypothetical protein
VLTIIKNTNHKIKHTKKSEMTKLRNIGYLRFGSKILQGFAGFFTSLTPPLSLSPLWISWAENEGAEGRARSFIFEEGACRPPAGRQAPSSNIKLQPFPLRPHFLPTRSREGRGREEG